MGVFGNLQVALLLKNSTIYFNGGLKKADIELTSKRLKLSKFIKNLNGKLKNSKFDINLKSSINFNDVNSSKIVYHINSDLVNIVGDYLYKSDEFNATAKLPKKSSLIGLDKNLHVEKLFPVKIEGKREKLDININAKNDIWAPLITLDTHNITNFFLGEALT